MLSARSSSVRPLGPHRRCPHAPPLPTAAAALKWYHRYQLIGWVVAVCFYSLKALPPAALTLTWPFFRPLWLRFGVVSVKEVLDRCGCKDGAAELVGVLTYLCKRRASRTLGRAVGPHAPVHSS